MGTLLNQKERDYLQLDEEVINQRIISLKSIASKHKISLENVLKLMSTMEQERANNLYVANGDIKDEQLAGFGELFIKYAESVKFI